MKELTQHLKEEIKVEAVKEIAKQHKFFGSLNPKKGQTVWQMDLNTLEITPAKFEEVNFIATGEGKGVHKKLVIKTDCIYNVALNMENAKRKFINRLNKGFK